MIAWTSWNKKEEKSESDSGNLRITIIGKTVKWNLYEKE